MTRTAEYGVPEGNQDRDEWMTAIEVQEYMEASRSKAYGLVWSGEIDSYKLDRKPLVSRASVDAYIESRSGGNDGVDHSETARRRMHTGTSRRKEFKDTQRHRAGDGVRVDGCRWKFAKGSVSSAKKTTRYPGRFSEDHLLHEVQARLDGNYLGTDNGIGARRHAGGKPQSKTQRALSGVPRGKRAIRR